MLLPAIAAYAVLILQTFPAPYQDDYHAILAFAADYQQQPPWKQKVLAIAADQHNEYKLAFEHSVIAVELQSTRHLNFLFLAILGDLTLLPIAYLLWKIYGEMGLRAFLPISFLFFALTYWETLDWAMTGLQNIPVILFSLLSIYLLIRSQELTSLGTLLLACLAAALAALTSANGFMLGPVGLLILLPRRAYARALAWCVSFAIPLAAYLFRFVPVAHPVVPYAFVTRPLFFLAFLGGIVPAPWAAALFGIAVLAVVVFALRSRFDRSHPVACYFALWILCTAAVVGWVRGAAGLSVASRYSVYSILLLIFCYAFLTHHLAARSSAVVRKVFYVASLVVAIAFCLAADLHAFQKLGERRHMVLSGIELYCANPAVNSPMIDPRILHAAPGEQAYERDILTEAAQKGIYTPACKERPQQR